MEVKTVYFEKPGIGNTEETLKIARKRAEELRIKTIVIASTGGDTAIKALEAFPGLRVIAVTHVAGMRQPDTQEFDEKIKQTVEARGGIVLTTTHALGGLSKAMRNKYDTFVLGEIIADTLRIFGQGIKVVCEITAMATDAGLVRTDEDIIAIGGSGRGADTAVVLRPANTHTFFDLKVREIICKPRL
ncbi:MAG TPA: pyruvate kinase alpha/beta domain-containing protein [Dehalococcoidales bacterium]|nr:pyruvate kinase alpha/beta domain-containing protein [Dehalococcoidales bacterium]